MRSLYLLSGVTLLLGLSLQMYAQSPPNVKVRTVGVSSHIAGLDATDGYDVPSNGLPNTAPGSKVYLEVYGTVSTNGTDWASATYTMLSAPSGSASALTMIDAIRASFVPDLEGTYKIMVTATDEASESGSDTITVNCAKYVGVGGIVSNPAFPQCRMCHAQIATNWDATGHAHGLSTYLDDATGHFRASCLGCHTTGSLDANATGDGFLHLMKSSSWTFPTALKPGNYDSLKLVDPTLAAHANVQCESCHGPGSAHGSVVTDNKIATTINHQQCITCHDAPDHHIKPNEWRASAHFNSVGEPDDPEHMNRGSKTSKDSDCARCHTSAGFIDVFVKSSNPPESSFSNAPYKEPGAVGCATCHDPHNAQNEHQLRKPVTELCASCHSVRVSGYSGLHNSHQGPMLQGRDGKEFPGYTYSNSTHTAVAEQCATCHMAAPEDPNLEYLYGGHTFHVTYNNGTPDDETDDVLNSTGCVSCHQGGITLEDVKETQDEIKAKLDELKGYLKLRTDGRPLFPTDNTLTTMEADIHFNWYFVNNDNSYGVHNKQYALDLLNSSIEEAKKLVSVEPIDNSIPRSASLAQNYPNPFNPSTTIEFSIPKGTNVRITVFDASGRTVNVLVNDYYTPGTYRTTWNGTSLIDGQRIANSGVYYYRIEAGNYTATKKMILMK